MTSAPVTVVIPTYNRRDIVRDAIDSVLGQTRLPAQILIVDDGSKDDTAESVSSYGDAVQYCYQSNAGLSAARNHGIWAATQPFVAFLDDDDVWHPRKIELQMRCFELEPAIGLLAAEQFDWPASEFPTVGENVDRYLRSVTWEQLVVRTLIPISSVVVRRELFERTGVFDVAMRSSEDRDLFLRAAELTRLGLLAMPLSGYRDTPGSMCKNPSGREEAMRQILRRLDERGVWNRRWLLRRKSYSFMHHCCSDAHARFGNHARAVVRTIKSLGYYPLPYSADEVRMRFERPKRLAVNLLRLAGLKKSDRDTSPRQLPATNALSRSRQGPAHCCGHGAARAT